MRKTIFILSIFFFSLTISLKAQNAVSTDDAKNFVNKDTTVIGEATQINTSKSGVVFINMDGKFPDNKFSAIIYKDDVPKFEDIKKMEGKTVEVSGKVQEYNGKYNVILKDPKQLTLVEKKSKASTVSKKSKK